MWYFGTAFSFDYCKRNKHTKIMKAAAMGHRKIKSPPLFPQHRNNTFNWTMRILTPHWALYGIQAAVVAHYSPTTCCCSHALLSQTIFLLLLTWNEYLKRVPCTLLLCCCDESRRLSPASVGLLLSTMLLHMFYQKGKGYAIENF